MIATVKRVQRGVNRFFGPTARSNYPPERQPELVGSRSSSRRRSSMDRASDFGSDGWGFESLRRHCRISDLTCCDMIRWSLRARGHRSFLALCIRDVSGFRGGRHDMETDRTPSCAPATRSLGGSCRRDRYRLGQVAAAPARHVPLKALCAASGHRVCFLG